MLSTLLLLALAACSPERAHAPDPKVMVGRITAWNAGVDALGVVGGTVSVRAASEDVTLDLATGAPGAQALAEARASLDGRCVVREFRRCSPARTAPCALLSTWGQCTEDGAGACLLLELRKGSGGRELYRVRATMPDSECSR